MDDAPTISGNDSLRNLSPDDLAWAKGMSAIAVGLGLVVLLGWALNIDEFKHVLPVLVAMKANTAAAFVVSGIGLHLHATQHPTVTVLRVRQASATLVLLLGVATLCEYHFNLDAGIDQILFAEPAGATLTSHPGRMSNITAINLTLLGSALILKDFRFWVASQASAVAIGVLSLSSLGGYMFGNLEATHFGNATAIAIHTAMGFLILAVGVVMTIPASNLMVRLRKKSQTIGLSISVGSLILVFSAVSYNFLEREKLDQLVDRTLNVLKIIESFSVSIHDYLYHNRGFIITGDERELQERDKQLDVMVQKLAEIRGLLSDSVIQRKRLNELNVLVKQRVELANELVRTRRERGLMAVAALLTRPDTDALTSKIELNLDDLERAEEEALKRQQELADVTNFSTLFTLAVLFLASLLHLLWILRNSKREIAERRRTETELRVAATTFQAEEGMTITDAAMVILRVNKAFTDITGYSAEEVVGQTPSILKSGRHDELFYASMWLQLRHTGVWQGEIWNRRKSGEIYPEWLTITAVRTDDGVVTHYVGIFSDITVRKSAEDEIRSLAFYDPLTKLPNRRLLLDRLRQALAASVRSRREGALLFIDLDNFKVLNDTLGHDKGDLLLIQVAQRLVACVREEDTVARLGGDEFVVMLVELSELAEEAGTQTEIVAEKILDLLNKPYILAGLEHHNSASIGVAVFRTPHSDADELMKRADIAMYKAKDAGRNAIRFFDPQMQALISNRAALEADLRQAVREGQFLLHYQAQVDSKGQLTGAEVLIRWQHPQRGLVPPAEFIPLAEESGLILPLGYWVLRTACAQLAAWAERPKLAHLGISVNVSARQFHQTNFVDQVAAVLTITDANPQRLKLELTESLFVSNVKDLIEKMSLLKAKGVGFSLDDFGTGYSSLSYLKRLPLDQLKIDQSFVRDVLTDPSDAAIARTIVALGQSLGMGVIAEGVETKEQVEFLAASGCHAYQGYLFSRPLPLDEFEEFARRARD